MLHLSEGAHGALAQIFDAKAAEHGRENGNGREVRNLLEQAKRAQALRLMERGGRASKDELMLLTEEDFATSLAALRSPPHAPPCAPPPCGGAGTAPPPPPPVLVAA